MKAQTTDEHRQPPGSLTVTDSLCLSNPTRTRFAAALFQLEIQHTVQSHWQTSSRALDGVLEYALSTAHQPRSQSALLNLQPLFGECSLALITLRDETVYCHLAAREQVTIEEIERWLHDRFPPTRPSDGREIPVRFWSCGTHGANSLTRTIAVPSFQEISDNYPSEVSGHLERLLAPDFPLGRGQLILWHGPPGTGKTYALRALAWEWREWCGLHYVIDPEVFFGARADYMLDVILDDDTLVFHGEQEHGPPRKWRLLVLEDTGELLAADAKERTGQGLSRLLNVVDGIVGQGLRILVLVSTNEPLRRLHPAVARPGRCATRLQFTPFSSGEAARWLAARGLEPVEQSTATLADLYARANGGEVQSEPLFGFTGRD